jgi:hypothetical protein
MFSPVTESVDDALQDTDEVGTARAVTKMNDMDGLTNTSRTTRLTNTE